MYDSHIIQLKVSGVTEQVTVKPYATLLDVLRDQLNHIEVKEGCGVGDCGACAVALNGVPVCACLVLARQADGAEIVTATGIGTPEQLHPLQEAFMDYGGIQCGFCTPGLIVTSKALLEENPHPSRQEILIALSGNYCRCTGYEQVVESVLAAAAKMDGNNA
ncbi:MAG: (2Fe-2S)-binding protein [Ardenticatenaceae bacterium]|nr:(2Fe-2S)-binding protein [Ardenticatenaceae bacterium]